MPFWHIWGQPALSPNTPFCEKRKTKQKKRNDQYTVTPLVWVRLYPRYTSVIRFIKLHRNNHFVGFCLLDIILVGKHSVSFIPVFSAYRAVHCPEFPSSCNLAPLQSVNRLQVSQESLRAVIFYNDTKAKTIFHNHLNVHFN